MTNTLKIYCKNTAEYVTIAGGDTLLDVARCLEGKLPQRPLCALVNNKVTSLHFQVFLPKQVEFLTATSRLGQRVYLLSLCMVLYKAVHELYPQARLRMEHSVAGGHYCRLYGEGVPVVDAAMTASVKARMRAIVAADIPLERHERLTSDVAAMFRQQGMDDKAALLETTHSLYTTYFAIGDTIDSYYSDLAPSTGYMDVFDLVPYKAGMLLLSMDADNPDRPSRMTAQDNLYDAFTEYNRLNEIIGIGNVSALNSAVERKHDISMLIAVAEALHERKFASIASEIVRRHEQGGARVVLLAGPSSSGKTTSSKRLAIQLMANLIVPKVISLDNYFVDRDKTPVDEYGERDYESLYALDLEQFNSDLNRLIAGEEVAMPTYNFETGSREYRGDTLQLHDNNILLMEGIHGLNPKLTEGIADDQKFRVYASALTTINIDDHNWLSTSDNRLLRRIVRDYKYRGTSARDTIARWPSVRRGEQKWIFPYQQNADATFNSSLIFELGVMRDYADAILRQVPHDVPEYAEASRLRCILSYFSPISDKSIPGTSLLREFLGGSAFKY